MQTKTLQTDLEYISRRERRKAVESILATLSAIRDAEQRYLDNVPDNLQSSESFEVGERAVEALDEILDLLVEIY